MPEAIQMPTRLVASASVGLRGQWAAPGDKSVSHRAIILAAMAEGTSSLSGLAAGDDVRRTLAAVQALGATVQVEGDLTRITGRKWRSPDQRVDCGNSGTAARLLIGSIAGMAGLDVTITGDESLSGRPMERLVEPLIRMGASIECGSACTLPIRIVGRRLCGIAHRNVPGSAQVKTALMFAGLGAEGVTRIIEPVKSRSHGEMLLRQFGAEVRTSHFAGSYAAALTPGQRLKATDVKVGGDPSSAAFPIVAGLIVPDSRIQIRDVILSPERRRLYDVLQKMGARVKVLERSSVDEPIGSITCRTSALQGVEVPAEFAPAMIDEYPIAAVAAACATGISIFRGLAELRHKESNRLERLAAGLNACGVHAQVIADDLIIHGVKQPYGNAVIDSHGDHRISMAFAVLGLASRYAIMIDRADKIGTSFPDFMKVMGRFGARMGWAR
jgi:3-phosphoshikimate 1-carboxyvinyltransferase